MLWRGIEIEPQWVVLALLLIAVALGRGREFIQDWTPFLVLFLAYEVMRGFAAKTGFAPHDLSGLEKGLFGGQLPTLVLQHAFYHPAMIGLQDWVAMGFYFLHFPLPIAVGFLFWVNSREHYWRYIAALLLMAFLAFVTYLFWPSAPPWFQDHAVHKVLNETVSKWGVSYLQSPIYYSLDHFNPNQFAAFPSLHAALPALAAFYAWRRYRVLALVLVVWTAGVWGSIVYLGEHYFVDALDGLLYTVLAAAAVELVAARRVRLPRPS
jgi:membrane-associated phospholipid phosphatase